MQPSKPPGGAGIAVRQHPSPRSQTLTRTKSLASTRARRIASSIADIKPSAFCEVGSAIQDNPDAMRAFGAIAVEMGFTDPSAGGGPLADGSGAGGEENRETNDGQQGEKRVINNTCNNNNKKKKHHSTVPLPPELENFKIIKEMPAVACALENEAFIDAQRDVQAAPDDQAALAVLQRAVAPIVVAYREALDARIQETKIKEECRAAIIVGNDGFKKVYDGVWNGALAPAEPDGLQAYHRAMQDLEVPPKALRQSARDPCKLFQHAGKIKSVYDALLTDLADGLEGIEPSIPKNLKKIDRIVEKALFKRKDDPGNADKVCDIVRGMVTCQSMAQVAEVVQRIGAHERIVVTRVKDRFLEAPSAGGWRDCMINFHVLGDPQKHICEIQLAHTMMLTARKGLPGHVVYNRVRNADEIVNMWMDREQPQLKAELQKWLIAWQGGDKLTRGPPNRWDVSKITDMSYLFCATSFTTIANGVNELMSFNDDIGDWDTSNVTNMASMFNRNDKFNQPIGAWNVSRVTNMMCMFMGATQFNQPLNSWDISQVRNMSNMFYAARSFEQSLSSWDLHPSTNIKDMFKDASKKIDRPLVDGKRFPSENKSVIVGGSPIKVKEGEETTSIGGLMVRGVLSGLSHANEQRQQEKETPTVGGVLMGAALAGGSYLANSFFLGKKK